MEKKILSREAILNADDLKTEEVYVKQWGGTVIVRTLTGAERDALESSLFGGDKKQNFVNLRARLVALTVIDESGKNLFTEADIEVLGRKSAKALDRVFSVAQKLNALSDKDVDDLVKKSDPSPQDNSTSS